MCDLSVLPNGQGCEDTTPCAAIEQLPHPTNGTPNLTHLLVIRLGKRKKNYENTLIRRC